MRTSAALGLLLLQACATEPDELSGPREVTVAWQIQGIGDVPAACPVGDMLQFDTGEYDLVPCHEAGQRTYTIETAVETMALSLMTGESIRTTSMVDVKPGVGSVDLVLYPEAAQLAAGWGFVDRKGQALSCATAGVDEVELHYALHEIDSQILTARFPCDQTVSRVRAEAGIAGIGIPPALELGVYVGQLHALRKGVEIGKSKGMFFVLDEYNTVGVGSDSAISIVDQARSTSRASESLTFSSNASRPKGFAMNCELPIGD